MVRTTLLILLLALSPQAAPQSENATVEGLVHRAGATEPIANVRITMTRTGAAALSATSDGGGHFAFKDVAPGQYTIAFQRDSYLRPMRGGGPKSLTVARRQEIKDLDLALVPGAAVIGRITDENGQSLSGVSVAALELGYRNGKRALERPDGDTRAVEAQTNDLGEFKLFWLLPGDYYIRARFAPRLQIATGGNAVNSITYYPGTPDASIATVVSLSESEEMGSINMRIPTHGVGVKISGNIESPQAAAKPDCRVSGVALIPLDANALIESGSLPYSNTAGITPPPDGRFEIRGVLPGSYDLLLTVSLGNSPTVVVRTRVDVAREDIEGLKINVASGMSVQGHVGFGKSTGTLPPRISVVLASDYSPRAFGASVGADGAFAISNVQPDHYRIGFAGGVLPAGTYIADIQQNGRSVFETGIDVNRETPPIEVLLESTGGTIDGVVQNAQQKPVGEAVVALVPAVARRQNSDLYRNVTTDAQGHFSFTGIAPGDYKIFAWERIPTGAYQNPDFLSNVEGRGQAVVIVPSDRQNLRINVIPSR